MRTLISSPSGTYGSLTAFNTDTGAYTYTLNNGTNGVAGLVQSLAQGETVSDSFNYTVVDQFGATNTSTLTITITGTNDAPVDGDECNNVTEDGTQTASGIVLANASDIDHGATLDATLISSPSGTYGSLTAVQQPTPGLHLHAEQRHQWRGGAGAVPLPRARTVTRQLQLHGGRSVRGDQHFDPHHHDHGHQRRTGRWR
jgi:VCBS repeat-containing protein